MKRVLAALASFWGGVAHYPRLSAHAAAALHFRNRGLAFGKIGCRRHKGTKLPEGCASNPLADYFESHKTGPGIFKWDHYFDIYHRHLSRFIGQPVHLLEVGIYSGGSLRMWSDYLGEGARIYGVDIEEACRAYENEKTSIFIGDQEDRDLWRRIKQDAPAIDVVIDDGGHLPEQQIATFEEMLPHIRPRGVYICEDIHGSNNRFAAYLQGLSNNLNSGSPIRRANKELSVDPSPFQSSIHGIYLYPFVAVVEVNAVAVQTLRARRHGTDWQPFS